MAEETASRSEEFSSNPQIRLPQAIYKPDLVTWIGMFSAVTVIALAIVIGQSDASFLNAPSFLIVVVGTIAATAVSFSADELKRSGGVFWKTFFRVQYNPATLAKNLLSLAVIAKKKGILALMNYERELQSNPFLFKAVQLVVDGYQPEEIERVLLLEVQALQYRHKRASEIVRRASEVAPAMGLIGTLVGLVQMLADLENPEAIGPAMAVALLTTFYGAIMGTVILAPLATKLEKYSYDESLIKFLITATVGSISRQENPRRLEMTLNAELPPHRKIKYFD